MRKSKSVVKSSIVEEGANDSKCDISAGLEYLIRNDLNFKEMPIESYSMGALFLCQYLSLGRFSFSINLTCFS